MTSKNIAALLLSIVVLACSKPSTHQSVLTPPLSDYDQETSIVEIEKDAYTKSDSREPLLTPVDQRAESEYSSSRRFSHASTTVDAIKYNLYFELNPAKAETTAVSQIRLRQVQPTPVLRLDAAENLVIKQVAINGKVTAVTRAPAYLEIALSQEDLEQTYIDLELQYLIKLSGEGIYYARNEKGEPSQVSVWSEPLGGRQWLVSIDRPDDKALFDMTINAPSPWKVLANGTLVDHVSQNGRETYSWQMNAPMPTYLASFTAGDLDVTTIKDAPVPTSYWTIPNQKADGLATFESSVRAMNIFNNLLIPYPFEKFSVAAAENAGGAMEHTTAVSFGSLVTEGAQYEAESAEFINVHELAHHWFGDTATCATWDHLWLNEGFATVSEVIYALEHYGQDMYLKKVKAMHDGYFAYETTENGSGGPVVNSKLTPSQMFSSIRYAKAGSILNMLRLEIGNQAFYSGLRQYLRDRFMLPAVTDDLQRALEKHANRSLEPFFQQWIYRAGYPDFKFVIAKDADGLKLTVTQKQTKVGLFSLKLPVQVILKDGSKTIQKFSISQKEKTFLLAADASNVETVVIDPEYSLLLKREIQMPQDLWSNLLDKEHGTYLHRIEALQATSARLTLLQLQGLIANKNIFVMTRAEALKIYASKFPEDAAYILSFATDSDKEMRRAVSVILRTLPLDNTSTVLATQALGRLLLNPAVPSIAISASETLARRKIPGAFEILSQEIVRPGRTNVHMRIASHLGILGDLRAVPVLQKAIDTGMVRIRSAAGESLGLLKAGNASQVLTNALMTEIEKSDSGYGDFSAMVAYVVSLNQIHDEVAKAGLEKFLTTEPPTRPKLLAQDLLSKW